MARIDFVNLERFKAAFSELMDTGLGEDELRSEILEVIPRKADEVESMLTAAGDVFELQTRAEASDDDEAWVARDHAYRAVIRRVNALFTEGASPMEGNVIKTTVGALKRTIREASKLRLGQDAGAGRQGADNDLDAAPGGGGSARTVDDLSEAEVRALLKKVQEDVIAGNRQESSSDVGDFVTNTLAEAGLQTEPTAEELAAEDAEWDED